MELVGIEYTIEFMAYLNFWFCS